MTLTARDRLIVALDLPTVTEARTLTGALGDTVQVYKIGYQLFPVGGYEFARQLVDEGRDVFLDLKLLDIGKTVERGVASLRHIGARFLTVHADPDAIKGACAGRGDGLRILAVTVLTSWDRTTLTTHGYDIPVDKLVLRRAEIAAENGADGVIASAREARLIRERFDDRLEIVTPGIRPKGASADDQKRIVTPGMAIADGADRLVLGRPIVAAPDPVAAANAISAEIANAVGGTIPPAG